MKKTLTLLACAAALSGCQSPSSLQCPPGPVVQIPELPGELARKREPTLRQRQQSFLMTSPAKAMTPSDKAIP